MARKYALYAGNLAYWQGGRWVLRLITRALVERAAAHAERVVLLLPKGSIIDDVARVGAWALRGAVNLARGRRPAPLLLRRVPREALGSVAANIAGPIEIGFCAPFLRAVTARLRRSGADVLVASSSALPEDFPLPWVGFISDLQHRYFPEIFTAPEIAYRDALFRAILDRAGSVVVNAVSVREDIARFFPGSRARVFDLPFAPMLEPVADARTAQAAVARYGVQAPFFVISNQFWIHKNHLTAFRALRRLEEEYGRRDVQLVCTGATSDYRSAGHFRRLMAELDALGVRARVRVLGNIPRAEHRALISLASAVVQPTLFEGTPGGGAAYDAVSLGVPLLASDIPVNREVDAGQVAFFSPHDERALADLMARTLDGQSARPTEEALRRLCRERSAKLAERLAEAVEFAIAAYGSRKPTR